MVIYGLASAGLRIFGLLTGNLPPGDDRHDPGVATPWPDILAIATGAVHFLAGLALIVGVKATLAARLLSGMFLSFGAFVWAPQVFASPSAIFPWAGSAINLALVGAVWALADLLSSQKSERAG